MLNSDVGLGRHACRWINVRKYDTAGVWLIHTEPMPYPKRTLSDPIVRGATALQVKLRVL